MSQVIVPRPINGLQWKDRVHMEGDVKCSLSRLIAVEVNLPVDLGGLILYLANGIEDMSDRTIDILKVVPKTLSLLSPQDQKWYAHLASRIDDLSVFRNEYYSLPEIKKYNEKIKVTEVYKKNLIMFQDRLVETISNAEKTKNKTLKYKAKIRNTRKLLARTRRTIDTVEQKMKRTREKQTVLVDNLDRDLLNVQHKKLRKYVAEMASLRTRLYPLIDEDLVDTEVEEDYSE